MNLSNLWRIPFDIGQFFADNVERTVLAQQLAERGAYPTDQIAQFFEDEYDVQYRPFLPAAMVESVDQLKARSLYTHETYPAWIPALWRFAPVVWYCTDAGFFCATHQSFGTARMRVYVARLILAAAFE